MTFRERLVAALTADADELRFHLQELQAVRQIMIEGNPQTVARLLLQADSGNLNLEHPWLNRYMRDKLASVRRGRASIILDERELGELENELWPEAQRGGGGAAYSEAGFGRRSRSPARAADFPSRRDAIDRVAALERIINTYCRASSGSIMQMGYEMAKINNTLAMKEAINLKLLGVAGTVVYLFGQWLFHGDDDSSSEA